MGIAEGKLDREGRTPAIYFVLSGFVNRPPCRESSHSCAFEKKLLAKEQVLAEYKKTGNCYKVGDARYSIRGAGACLRRKISVT